MNYNQRWLIPITQKSNLYSNQAEIKIKMYRINQIYVNIVLHTLTHKL